MKPTTLVFPIDEQHRILLGRKKRGFGADKYNGSPFLTFSFLMMKV